MVGEAYSGPQTQSPLCRPRRKKRREFALDRSCFTLNPWTSPWLSKLTDVFWHKIKTIRTEQTIVGEVGVCDVIWWEPLDSKSLDVTMVSKAYKRPLTHSPELADWGDRREKVMCAFIRSKPLHSEHTNLFLVSEVEPHPQTQSRDHAFRGDRRGEGGDLYPASGSDQYWCARRRWKGFYNHYRK